MVEKHCSCIDTIPACDKQTDGRTYCHGVVRVMHSTRDCVQVVSVLTAEFLVLTFITELL